MSTPVLDPVTLERLRALQTSVGSSAKVLEELSDIFARDSLTYLEALAIALKAGDIEQGRRLLHTLKGAALSVGAAQVAERCRQLEEVEPLAAPETAEELRGVVGAALEALREAQRAG